MSKAAFIRKIQQMDPKSRARLVEQSDVPEAVKEEAREDEKEHLRREREDRADAPALYKAVPEAVAIE